MQPPSNMPLHEAVQYYGADSTPTDVLIQALREYHEYAEDAPDVEKLRAEIKTLENRIDELEKDLVDSNECLAESQRENESLKEELSARQTTT